MGGTSFGVGYSNPTSQLSPFGLSPFGAQGLTSYPLALSQQQGQPLQQIFQILQSLPQQLQHLQQLQYVQQQQLQQVQHLLQVIPAQLAQLQQLIQYAPHQIQQLLQPSPVQQPFGQMPGVGGYSTSPQWGGVPQVFGAQSSYVM